MKTRVVLLSFVTFTILSAAVAALLVQRPGISRHAMVDSQRTFEVTGTVLRINPGARTVRIAHQQIPDYMPAMTMPFTVAIPSLLEQIHVGDTVQFQLVV